MTETAAPRLRVLSLGAGVQSTTMALMAAHGEFGVMPDFALFADTGAEPPSVYQHLEWLTSPNVLPFPVRILKERNLLEDARKGLNSTGHRWAAIPWFLDRGAKGLAMGKRQCTKEYKLVPLSREQRRLVGAVGRERIAAGAVEIWIGISTDEAGRMKPARVQWQTNRWPLIEKNMSRGDCLAWLEKNGYPRPPKSACSFCPYRSDESWMRLKQDEPEAFAQACEIDDAMRGAAASHRDRLKATPYLHRSLKPLREVEFDPAAGKQPDMFNEECEGMCGI